MRDELDLQLALIDQRALVVLVEAPEALDGPLAALLDDLSVAHALPADAVTCADPEPDALRALNHDRDALMRRQRLIWLRARRPADVRTIRDNTPDLTAAVDLYVRLTAPTGSPEDWARCRVALAALMAAEHGHLTTFGLEKLRPPIPIDEGCCPLVDWPSGEHRVLLMGGAGSGKTTALRHLAWTYATGAGDPLGIGDRVPLLVPASDYVEDTLAQRTRPWPEFLVDWLRARQIPGAEALPAHLGEVLLLVDDLDTVWWSGAPGVLEDIVAQCPGAAGVAASRIFGRGLPSGPGPRGLRHLSWPRAWRWLEPRRPSLVESRHIFATHAPGPTDPDTPWVISFMQRLSEAESVRDMVAWPGGLAALAALAVLTDTSPAQMPYAWSRANAYRLLTELSFRWSIRFLPRGQGPGADGWMVGVIGRLGWKAVESGGLLNAQFIRSCVARWARSSSGDPANSADQEWRDRAIHWLMDDGPFLERTRSGRYRFTDRLLAETLAADWLIESPTIEGLNRSHLPPVVRDPVFDEVLCFWVQSVLARGEVDGRDVASLLIHNVPRPSERSARPLLMLVESEALNDVADLAMQARDMLAEACFATAAFGGDDPTLQQPWLRVVRQRLDAAHQSETHGILERWLVNELEDVAWPALLPEGDALAATANSTDLSHQDMRALLGDIPPELGRLLHRARLPVEPLVAYLRARSEWWLRVLADWTEASFAAPGDDFTLPVPEWLRAEAAAEAR